MINNQINETDLSKMQEDLDRVKYCKSIHFGDLSGKMPYCAECQFRLVTNENGYICPCRQDIVNKYCLCAKANIIALSKIDGDITMR